MSNFINRAINDTTIDAFGRLRVSNPITLFDSKQIFDNGPLFWDDSEESGGSTTSSHSTDTASTTIGVALNTAGVRTRQTFMRFNYQPGKSQLIFCTFVMDKSGGGTGITRLIGYGDDNNGIFLKDNEGTYQIVRRTYTSGAAVDNAVSQTSWNLDTMDGNGNSGITLDFTKAQIMLIDFEWLGVGRVRIGFVVDGAIYYAHQFLNTNSLDVVYMSTPNLPLRYQIENDGTGAASTLEHICSTVISEGGQQNLGTLRYKSTAGTHVDCNTENSLYAIVGVKLKSTHIAERIDIINVSLAEHAGSKDLEWVLLLNPTVAGTFTYANETNSAIMTATGASTNTVTGGTAITGGHFSSAQKGGSTGTSIDNAIRLGAAIDGTVDEIVLCARPIGGSTNTDVEGSITWREYS